MTEIHRSKESAGNCIPVMGDVSSTLFAAGTPDDIYIYVQELVCDVGRTGLLKMSRPL
jgi:hypothetical protein